MTNGRLSGSFAKLYNLKIDPVMKVLQVKMVDETGLRNMNSNTSNNMHESMTSQLQLEKVTSSSVSPIAITKATTPSDFQDIQTFAHDPCQSGSQIAKENENDHENV